MPLEAVARATMTASFVKDIASKECYKTQAEENLCGLGFPRPTTDSFYTYRTINQTAAKELFMKNDVKKSLSR